MTDVENGAVVAMSSTAVARPTGRLRAMGAELIGSPAAVFAVVWTTIVVVLAVGGGHLAPHDPQAQNFSLSLTGPGPGHWLGTDQLGRDTLSRLIAGTRSTVLTALESTAVAAVLGSTVGVLLGFFGRWADRLAMRVVDLVMAVPGVLVAFAVLAIFGNRLTVAMLAVGVTLAPAFVRLARGRVLAVRSEPYVEAATVGGLPRWRILLHHVVPATTGPLVVQTALVLGHSILIQAALNYIGLGAPPPAVTWGSMLSDAVGLAGQQWFVPIPPGLVIVLTVLTANLLGDALRDVLHPESRPARTRRTGVTPPAASTDEPVDPDTAVLVRGLTVTLSDARICDGVDLQVRTGEIVGLVGESGCGKTTLGLSLLGLLDAELRVTADRLHATGLDLLGLRDEQWRQVRGRRMAMVFQEPQANLHPAHRIGDQLADALHHQAGLDRRAARARAVELLAEAEVPDPERVARSYPHELSGGLAQRAMIALALSCDPAVLLADEPTTALDVTVQADILRLLARLRVERGLSIVFITHDLAVAAQLCDRVVVMYAGQIVESADAVTLFARPRHPYTRALIDAVPRLHTPQPRLATIRGRVPAPRAWSPGCRFRSRCPYAAEQCATPIPEVAGPAGTVRCVRAEELVGDG